MTFLPCDPGWYVHKPDVQNKWDDNTHKHNVLVKWTLDFEMDSQEVFGDFGSKDSPLRCFVVQLIWPSWNCGHFVGVYVKIEISMDSMVIVEMKGFKYSKILEPYPPIVV